MLKHFQQKGALVFFAHNAVMSYQQQHHYTIYSSYPPEN